MYRGIENSSGGGGMTIYKLKAIGQKFVNGVSSRYDHQYDRILENVLSESELRRIVDDLNEILVSHWPCTTCYFCGYLCLPCTFGLSLVGPGYCASYSEQHGQKFLRNVSLTAKFYDRGISFAIVKTMCDSYVEVRFPSHLAPRSRHSGGDLETGNNTTSESEGGISQLTERAAEMSPLLNTISGGRRIKDN